MGFSGAFLSNFTVSIFTRRQLFIGFHFLIGISLMMAGYCVRLQNADLVLTGISLMILSFQMSNGSAFWIYVGEIATEQAIGLCLLMLMGLLLIQSLVANALMSAMGYEVFFYVFAGFQLVICAVFYVFLRETKGLSNEQKMKLYAPKN